MKRIVVHQKTVEASLAPTHQFIRYFLNLLTLVFLLLALVFIGAMLTSCKDKKEDKGGNSNPPTQNNAPIPRQPRDSLIDPNAPPPKRNPDGTIGLYEGNEQVERKAEGYAHSAQSEGITNVLSAQNEGMTRSQNNEDWMLVLVNADNPLPDNYSPKLKSLSNGLKFDERAIDHLNAMLSEMRSQGLSPVVCSAYRTVEYQRTLFNHKVSQLTAAGLTQTQAENEARRHIAYPGTSEHNLGLAVDIVSVEYQLLDDNQANTAEAKWLLENCAEYGFILRYPKDKESVTGVKYEPWHFRYIGVTAAREIMDDGLCLEEYLNGQK